LSDLSIIFQLTKNLKDSANKISLNKKIIETKKLRIF